MTTARLHSQDVSTTLVEAKPARATRETALWHGLAHMPTVKRTEVVLVRGEGAYVWDEQGRKLLDAPASLWYCNVGHGRTEIGEAVAAQMRALEAYSTFQQFATRPAIDLADRLTALVPIENAKVFFVSGGSDAVDTAAKLARCYWHAVGKPEKRIVVTREQGYHGLHGFGTSIVGIEALREGYGPLVLDTMRVPANDAAAFERLLADRGGEIAAFFCEPIIGSGGVIHPAPGYLEAVQRACREHDVLFVVDEVITGFGRTGELFASQRFGLEPDMMLVAKGITSGYLPLGATIIGERVWGPFWEDGSELVFRHGLTYTGHASVCAAAHANLDILEREGLVARARSLEGVLEAALRPLEEHELVREVRAGVGLMAGVQVTDQATAERVTAACLDKGVLTRPLMNATIHISPPFVLTEDDIALLAEALRAALDEVARG